MPFGRTKGTKICYVITHNVICTNWKTDSFVYRWLCALAMFDVSLLPASDIISSVLLIGQFILSESEVFGQYDSGG